VSEIRRAMIAVYDKTGVVELARDLVDLGVAIVSSGGTARIISEAGLSVTTVEEVTGFPELLEGRVKTLHPRIHAGLLADRRKGSHAAELERHGIEPFDLLVVNLYPFRETVEGGAGSDDAIEKIDIGGPAMIRAAAKNFESVTVIVDPARYADVLGELRTRGGITREMRLALAADAFAHTASYDAAVAGWFGSIGKVDDEAPLLPRFVGLALEKVEELRYGENPHQRGGLYRDATKAGRLGPVEVLQGKEMSFNNWLDAFAAHDLARALPPDACVIVKHNNPCGAAAKATPADSYRAAFECDAVSAFGGVVAFHGVCDEATAEAMREVFTEVVVAREFTAGALRAFSEKRNLRVLTMAELPSRGLDVRTVPGGALVQEPDLLVETPGDFKVVSSREPTAGEWQDVLLAWTIAWRVKSNAIVFVRDRATVGVGAGQMSRVDSSWMAVRKAGERARGAVMASDAFFPFPDAVEVAADAGVTAVIHPGGSIKDEDVLAAAEARGMAVVVTGRRHFRH
jgi:phosphoribosylaminoimidazolecarboxamide formyltransferase/IMP cyclohydrolase